MKIDQSLPTISEKFMEKLREQIRLPVAREFNGKIRIPIWHRIRCNYAPPALDFFLDAARISFLETPSEFPSDQTYIRDHIREHET